MKIDLLGLWRAIGLDVFFADCVFDALFKRHVSQAGVDAAHLFKRMRLDHLLSFSLIL